MTCHHKAQGNDLGVGNAQHTIERGYDWVKREIAGWPVANLAVNNAIKVLVDQSYVSLCAKGLLVYQRDDLAEDSVKFTGEEMRTSSTKKVFVYTTTTLAMP
jgi:hypothetical protein